MNPADAEFTKSKRLVVPRSRAAPRFFMRKMVPDIFVVCSCVRSSRQATAQPV
jgi:hypothetical protein